MFVSLPKTIQHGQHESFGGEKRQKVRAGCTSFYAGLYVKNKRGVYEYLLGGEHDKKHLDLRIFDEPTKKAVYARQTDEAKAKHVSNCPHCALENAANRAKGNR